MNLKPGHKVMIKTWEDMEKEFGLHKSHHKTIDTVFWTHKLEEEIPDNRIIILGEEGTDSAGDFFGWKMWNIYSGAIASVCIEETSNSAKWAPPGQVETDVQDGLIESKLPEDVEKTYEVEHHRAEALEAMVNGKNIEIARLEKELNKREDVGGTTADFCELQYRCNRSEERLRIIEAILNPDRDEYE